MKIDILGMPHLDDARAIDQHAILAKPCLGHGQNAVTSEGILEQGPSTKFAMGFHQVGLPIWVLPLCGSNHSPTVVLSVSAANPELGLEAIAHATELIITLN